MTWTLQFNPVFKGGFSRGSAILDTCCLQKFNIKGITRIKVFYCFFLADLFVGCSILNHCCYHVFSCNVETDELLKWNSCYNRETGN